MDKKSGKRLSTPAGVAGKEPVGAQDLSHGKDRSQGAQFSDRIIRVRPVRISQRLALFIAAAILTAASVFFLVFNFYYNYLFSLGDSYDLNLFAHLTWRNDRFDHFSDPDASFFLVHIVPFLYGLNLLSYIMPTDQETWFSAWMAVIHASYGPTALGLWWILTARSGAGPVTREVPAQGYGDESWASRRVPWLRFSGQGTVAMLGLILALSFALNGIVLKSLWIGHYEFVIPLGLIALFIAVATRDWRLIGSALVFLTLLREDTGFHAFSFLSLLIAWRWLLEKQSLASLRLEIIVAGLCFAYSVLCIGVIMPLTDGDRVVQSIWAGDPPWAHLTWDRMVQVMAWHWERNAHLYLPALVLIGAAIWLRRPVWLIGLLAPLPWVGLHLIAAHDGSSYVYTYKAFPFVITLIWPLIMEVFDLLRTHADGQKADRPAGIEPLAPVRVFAVQMLIFAACILPWVQSAPALAGVKADQVLGRHPCAEDRTAHDAFRQALPSIRGAYQRILVSPGVRRLAPEHFSPADMAVWYGGDAERKMKRARPQVFIFRAGGRGGITFFNLARRAGLRAFQRVPRTSIVVATKRHAERLRGGGPELVPTGQTYVPMFCANDPLPGSSR